MADNNLSQSATVYTNEVRLHDWHKAYMAITFGDSDVDGGYGYLNLKYKANEEKVDYIIDRETFNFAGPMNLTLNDYKVWHENNDGPNSGLNADLLDGKHAVEFKDRYGYHHFMHMFIPPTTDKKHWTKIARFSIRKIGNAPDFNKEGTPPYYGAFKYTGNGVQGVGDNDVVVPGGDLNYAEDAIRALMVKDQIAGFKANTPFMLDEHDPDLFHTTTMITNGIYNGTLRGCVTILKENHPTTFDFHVGLFEDPLSTVTDGWDSLHKYFYVSLHDETLPFLNETYDDWGAGVYADVYLNIGVLDPTKVNEDTDDKNGETKVDGVVQDSYNVNGVNRTTQFPNYPKYTWEDPIAKLGYSTNVYITAPSSVKANGLRAIKMAYDGSAEAALADQVHTATTISTSVSNSTSSYSRTVDDVVVKDPTTGDVTFDIEESVSVGPSSYDTDADSSEAQFYHRHKRPDMIVDLEGGQFGNYNEIPLYQQDVFPYDKDRKRKAFPAHNVLGEGDSYQQFIDIMRLYHVDSRVDVIDNVTVVTHIFDLYIASDGKTEVRVQPYQSSACLLYNFETPIQEGELPAKKFLRPKSIYDSRYASVHHRHYDYERRIWELTLELDGLWKTIPKYLQIDQGRYNSKKVMMTDIQGKVFAADDNFERHSEPVSDRRMGNKVLVTMLENVSRNIDGIVSAQNACIAESSITTNELAQLEGISENIQAALNKIRKAVNYIAKRVKNLEEAVSELQLAIQGIQSSLGDFVKKTGDQMTGSLWMKYNGKAYKDDPAGYEKPESFVGVKFFSDAPGAQHGGYLYGATKESHIGLGIERVPGSGAQSDWALAVTPTIDQPGGAAIMINGMRIQFTKNGRGGGGTPSTYNLDFEKLLKWWHNEIAPTTSYGELDG